MNLSLGYTLVSNVAHAGARDKICSVVPRLSSSCGRRDLLADESIAAVIRALLLPVVEQALGDGAIAVGATWFDKRPARNWKVQWHQDLSVPATSDHLRIVLKDRIPHVQPGEDVLAKLLIARLHLDLSNDRTGGLAIVPGSHLRGRISEKDIAAIVRDLGVRHPECPAGSVFLMRPLLLHSSSASQEPVSRRVLQVLFAPHALASFPWVQTAA